MNKFKNRPEVLSHVKSVGFNFLLDTSIKYNLLAHCYVDFFTIEPSSDTDECFAGIPIPSLDDVFEHIGNKKIRCKDGINRVLDMVKFNFDYEDRAYSEIFYIDSSICTSFTKKMHASGILGTDFLKKHKFTIDFNNMTITRK